MHTWSLWWCLMYICTDQDGWHFQGSDNIRSYRDFIVVIPWYFSAGLTIWTPVSHKWDANKNLPIDMVDLHQPFLFSGVLIYHCHQCIFLRVYQNFVKQNMQFENFLILAHEVSTPGRDSAQDDPWLDLIMLQLSQWSCQIIIGIDIETMPGF